MSLLARQIVPQDPPAMVQRFMAQAVEMHPALTGELDFSGEIEADGIAYGTDSSPAINQLYSYMRDQFPEGGQPYWSVRAWTLLIWQPAFLVVAAVHGAGLSLDLLRLQQKCKSGIVAGFRIPEDGLAGAGVGCTESRLIAFAGSSLRMLADDLFVQLTDVTRLKPLSAQRLLADCLLGAFMRLNQVQPEKGSDRIMALAGQWLEAAGLAGESALVPLELNDGSTALGLDRKACCMDYRRSDGKLCSSCPKFKRPERLQRMQEELSLAAAAD